MTEIPTISPDAIADLLMRINPQPATRAAIIQANPVTRPATLAELVKDNYRIGKQLFGESSLDTLAYLRNLCANSDTDPASVSIAPYQTSDDTLLTKRGSINSRFFAKLFVGEHKAEEPDDKREASLAAFTMLNKAAETTIKNYEDVHKRRIRDDMQSAENRLNVARSSLNTATATYQERWAIFAKSVRTTQSSEVATTNIKLLAEELQQPFWSECKPWANNNGKFELLTQEIVLTIPVDEEHSYTINVGRVKVVFDVTTRTIQVDEEHRYPDGRDDHEKLHGTIATTRNYAAWRTFHPFMRAQDNPRPLCLGGEQDAYNRFYNEGNLGAMLSMHRQVLSHYSPDTTPWVSPYEKIQEFERQVVHQNQHYLERPSIVAPHIEGLTNSKWRFKRNDIKVRNSSLSL